MPINVVEDCRIAVEWAMDAGFVLGLLVGAAGTCLVMLWIRHAD